MDLTEWSATKVTYIKAHPANPTDAVGPSARLKAAPMAVITQFAGHGRHDPIGICLRKAHPPTLDAGQRVAGDRGHRSSSMRLTLAATSA